MEAEMNDAYLMALVLTAPACLCLPRPGHPSSHSHMLKSIAERHGPAATAATLTPHATRPPPLLRTASRHEGMIQSFGFRT